MHVCRCYFYFYYYYFVVGYALRILFEFVDFSSFFMYFSFHWNMLNIEEKESPLPL